MGNVHEGPHALNGRNTTVFKPGMIVTDEPGVYEGGVVGIRIENELECYHKASNQYGEFLAFRPITFVPIATSPIVPGVLSRDELDWLNAYHREVFEKLAPRLTEDERDWLAKKCAAIERKILLKGSPDRGARDMPVSAGWSGERLNFNKSGRPAGPPAFLRMRSLPCALSSRLSPRR